MLSGSGTAILRRRLLSGIFCLQAAFTLSAVSFSSEIDAYVQGYIQTSDMASSLTDHQLQIDSELSLFEGPVQINAIARLQTRPLLFSVLNLSAIWYINDYLDIRFGLLSDTWSPATFFPAGVFFSPMGFPSELGTGSLDSGVRLESTWYLPAAYLRVHVSPGIPDLSLPDPDSIWFPHASTPSIISVRPYGQERIIWYREKLAIKHVQPEPRIDKLSAALEAGISTMWLDVAFMLYRGWNQRNIIEQNTELLVENGEPQDFTLTMAPYYSQHVVAATKLSTSYKSFWSWFEAAYSPDSAIALAITAAEKTVSSAPFLAGSLGGGWFLPGGWGTLLMEGHYHHIFSDERYSSPPLSRALAVLLDLTPPRVPWIILKLGGILDIPRLDSEPALAGMTELQFRPDDQVLLYLSGLSFFSRRRSSFLYNYREIQRLQIGIRLFI